MDSTFLGVQIDENPVAFVQIALEEAADFRVKGGGAIIRRCQRLRHLY